MKQPHPRSGFNRWTFEPLFAFIGPLIGLLTVVAYVLSLVIRDRFGETGAVLGLALLVAVFVVWTAFRIEKSLRRERSH